MSSDARGKAGFWQRRRGRKHEKQLAMARKLAALSQDPEGSQLRLKSRTEGTGGGGAGGC